MGKRRMDYHLHTEYSFDGRQGVEELCERMEALGVEEVCLTEHIEPGHPEPGVDRPPDWTAWFREIERARENHPALAIRAGVEIGDNPACRDEIVRMLDPLPLDFRLLSLHLVQGVDCYNRDAYFGGRSRAEAYRRYAEAKAESICAWSDFDSVAHIGYVARYSPYVGEERPLRFLDAPDALDVLLRRVIETEKCIEINTSGIGGGVFLPDESIVRRYIALGGTCFTFGSDSHDAGRDYEGVERAKEWVRALGGRYQVSYERRRPCRYRL